MREISNLPTYSTWQIDQKTAFYKMIYWRLYKDVLLFIIIYFPDDKNKVSGSYLKSFSISKLYIDISFIPLNDNQI